LEILEGASHAVTRRNGLVTRVGPGTPFGNVMRRYGHGRDLGADGAARRPTLRLTGPQPAKEPAWQ
jgi:hypothetical protein